MTEKPRKRRHGDRRDGIWLRDLDPMHGFTPNYIRVEVPHDDALDNCVVTLRLKEWNDDGTALKGERI